MSSLYRPYLATGTNKEVLRLFEVACVSSEGAGLLDMVLCYGRNPPPKVIFCFFFERFRLNLIHRASVSNLRLIPGSTLVMHKATRSTYEQAFSIPRPMIGRTGYWSGGCNTSYENCTPNLDECKLIIRIRVHTQATSASDNSSYSVAEWQPSRKACTRRRETTATDYKACTDCQTESFKQCIRCSMRAEPAMLLN